MNNHEENLKKIIENQKILANEIQELNNAILFKKEQFLKMQGIVEYLSENNNSLEDSKTVEK